MIDYPIFSDVGPLQVGCELGLEPVAKQPLVSDPNIYFEFGSIFRDSD
jgi:hypothetical protein